MIDAQTTTGTAGIVPLRRNEKHLFVLAPDLYRSADADAIAATIAGLREMGIYNLPYHRDLYIQVTARDMISCEGKFPWQIDPACYVIFGPLGEQEDRRAKALLTNPRTGFTTDLFSDEEVAAGSRPDYPAARTIEAAWIACMQITNLLIALLATRNAVKTTRVNKLARLGVGKGNPRNRFAYTTTISLPADLEDDAEHPPTGAKKCPHLRRGHIRRQHYGPGHAYEKKVWIEPVFVNADPSFVSTRRAYNVLTPNPKVQS